MLPGSFHRFFLGLPQTVGNPRLVQIVGGHLHFYAVADRKPDPALAHLATDGGQNEMLVLEFDAEHGAGEHSRDATFHFDMFFFH